MRRAADGFILACALTACVGPPADTEPTCDVLEPAVAVACGSPLGLPLGAAVDEAYLYVLDDRGRVLRVPKTGGTRETIALVDTSGANSALGRLDLDADHVFAAAGDAVHRLDKDGANDTILLPTAVDRTSISVDEAYVYVALSPDGAILRAPKQGGGSEVLVPAGDREILSLLVDDTHVYWTVRDPVSVRRVAKTGGAIEVLVDTGVRIAGGRMVANDESVYVLVGFHDLLRIPKRDPSEAAEMELPDGYATGLAVDDRFVYAGFQRADDDAIVRMPVSGGAAETLVQFPRRLPLQVLADSGHVYWIDSTGSIYVVASN